ncbi:hypothetical protein LIER_43293 [Lithospermum erythrorhizon]|uniref:Uncharacterized protein n=1 Tax=Lithospermum erythrorhizon TaxID=34254 RepID=A0AAV3PSU8_LITER
MHQWNNDNGMALQPPAHVKLASRPKKSRKKDIDEIRKIGRTEKLRKWVISSLIVQFLMVLRESSKKKAPEPVEAEPAKPVEAEPAPTESQPMEPAPEYVEAEPAEQLVRKKQATRRGGSSRAAAKRRNRGV